MVMKLELNQLKHVTHVTCMCVCIIGVCVCVLTQMHMDGRILAQVTSGEKHIMVLFVYTPAYKLNTHDSMIS